MRYKTVNKYQVIGDICIITTNGKKKRQFIIDKEDYDRIKGFGWYVGPGDYIVAPAKFKTYSKNGNLFRPRVYLHRLIMKASIDDLICFKNKDNNDYRKENLIVVNDEHKHAYKRHYKTYAGKPTSSRYKGVTRYNYGQGGWLAQIGYKGKLHNLGVYKTQEEAAEAYNNKAYEFWGEYANLNKLTSV